MHTYSICLFSAMLALIPSVFANQCKGGPPYSWYLACPCDPNGLECQVCGHSESIANLYCQAYKLTSSKAKLQSNPSDAFTTWTNLTVAAPNPNNPISPSSKKHYLRSTSGTGTLAFTTGNSFIGNNLGLLHSFNYACASVNETKSRNSSITRAAVPCNVTVTQTCPATDYDFYGIIDFVNSVNMTYDLADSTSTSTSIATSSKNTARGKAQYANMATAGPSWAANAQPPVPSDYNEINACYNYTWTATQADGSPAYLYLDDVVYATYTGDGYSK